MLLPQSITVAVSLALIQLSNDTSTFKKIVETLFIVFKCILKLWPQKTCDDDCHVDGIHIHIIKKCYLFP